MPLSAYIHAHLWAISHDGKVFFTPMEQASWQVVDLPSTAITLTPSPILNTVFIACSDKTIHAVHSTTGDILRSSPDPLYNRPLCLISVPVENALFAGLTDGAVVRIHLPSLAYDCMLGCGVEHAAAVHALAVDNHYLYSAGDDAVVLVWDLKDLTTVRDFSVSKVPIRSLLRINFVLWLGLSNGSVQVIEIFGDDLNGVTNVSAKRAHSSPVVNLIQIGDTTVWSIESMPPSLKLERRHFETNDEHNIMCPVSNVAVWNVHDFTYKLSEDLEDNFIIGLSIVKRIPYERITVAAVSRDLSTQFITSDVASTNPNSSASASTSSLSLPSSSTLPQLNIPGGHEQSVQQQQQQQHAGTSANASTNQISSDEMAYTNMYVADLEQQLEQANDKIQTLSSAIPGSAATTPAPPTHDEFGGRLVVTEDEAIDSEDVNEERMLATDPFAMPLPLSVTDAIQATLSNLAESLVTLLTDEVLPSTSSATNTNTITSSSSPAATNTTTTMQRAAMRDQEHEERVRTTIASLTKELNTARQLVAYSANASADDSSRSVQLLKQINGGLGMNSEEIHPTHSHTPRKSPLRSRSLSSIPTEEAVRDLKRRLDSSMHKSETLQSDVCAITHERDMLNEEITQERTQAEEALSSLQALLRERSATVEARDAEIEELRNALDEAEERERGWKTGVANSKNTVKSLEDRLQACVGDLKTEIEQKRKLTQRTDEIKARNRRLAERCKRVENELKEATDAVNDARIEVANARKEEQLRRKRQQQQQQLLQQQLQQLQLQLQQQQQQQQKTVNTFPPVPGVNTLTEAEGMTATTNTDMLTNVNTNTETNTNLNTNTNASATTTTSASASTSGPARKGEGEKDKQRQRYERLKERERGGTGSSGGGGGGEKERELLSTLSESELMMGESEDLRNDNDEFQKNSDILVEDLRARLQRRQRQAGEKLDNHLPLERRSEQGQELEQEVKRKEQIEIKEREERKEHHQQIDDNDSDDYKLKETMSPEELKKELDWALNRIAELETDDITIQDKNATTTTTTSTNSNGMFMHHENDISLGTDNDEASMDYSKDSNVHYVNNVEFNGHANGQGTFESSRELQIGREKIVVENQTTFEDGKINQQELRNEATVELARLKQEITVMQNESKALKEQIGNLSNELESKRKSAVEEKEQDEEEKEEEREDYVRIQERELNLMKEEMSLLESEIEHRQAAASIYEEEAENMKCVIGDLRDAASELQKLLERSDEDSRELACRLEEMKTVVRMRDMKVAQLEGRIAALSCTTSTSTSYPWSVCEESHDSENIETNYNDVHTSSNIKALKALLASANGEIEQMSKELEAMYHSQYARDKEIEGLYEGITLREERIKQRESIIDHLRKSSQRAPNTTSNNGRRSRSRRDMNGLDDQQEHEMNDDMIVEQQQECSASSTSTTSTSSCTTRSSTSSTWNSTAMYAALDGVELKSTLKELEKGVGITKDRMKDVLRLAKQYKLLAEHHTRMLPILYEIERGLERIDQTKWNRSISFIRGIIQNSIIVFYTSDQKKQAFKREERCNYHVFIKEQGEQVERRKALVKSVERLKQQRL